MIYRFRVILDTDEDVFRDIEIEASADMEQFHDVITQSFGFEGQEMASFYISDEKWQQGEEIALFDMSEGEEQVRVMQDTILEDAVWEQQTRLIYVYDFLNLWTFLVELAEVAEYEDGRSYPNLMFAQGQLPDVAPEKEFEGEDIDELDAAYGEEDYDLDPDDYEDLDFDENWN